MVEVEFDKKTGWAIIPGSTKQVVLHFKNGHTEEMKLVEFLALKPKIKKQIVKIDCYNENEIRNLSK